MKKQSSKNNYGAKSIALHKKFGGKLELNSKFKLKDKNDLSLAYTPGVGQVCLEIAKAGEKNSKIFSLKKNTIAVVSDGSAVLGLGNLGPYGAIPVMEGKSVLMKFFAGVDAFPICLDTQDTEEIIKAVKQIAPVFGGINLEDISAPRCFEIEERLKNELNIPVMHDDQWGAATVTLAAAINAFKVLKKDIKTSTCVVSGVGAAGLASIKLLHAYAPKMKILALDSKGIISSKRSDLNNEKIKLIENKEIYSDLDGDLSLALKDADIFVGLSKPGILTTQMIKTMNKNPIIFALANPIPEIMPEEALKAGVGIMATGRSDYPNQINNSVFFPGFWRGMLERSNKGKNIKYDLKVLVKAAEVLAKSIKPGKNNILPSTLDKKVHKLVAKTIANYK